jgi:hypothetical protein
MNRYKMKNERKEQIDKEVEKTFQQLDRFERLGNDPFFYTRLQAQLKSVRNQHVPSGLVLFVTRNLRPAFLVLLLLLNLVSALIVFQNRNSASNSQTANISSFADEYSINDKSYDEYFTNN